jgi:hypothetical protein
MGAQSEKEHVTQYSINVAEPWKPLQKRAVPVGALLAAPSSGRASPAPTTPPLGIGHRIYAIACPFDERHSNWRGHNVFWHADAGEVRVSWRTAMSIRPLRWILFATVLGLLLLAPSFGAEWPVPPSGQPAQMSSKVDYDPKLADPFFKANEWSYPDYNLQGIPFDKRPKEPPRLQHTAKCFSTSGHSTPEENEHLVRFCEARLVDAHTIDLFIHEDNAEFFDNLTVRIKDGMFTCQYWTGYKGPGKADWIWTTTRQSLTLDKKTYRKGDVMKGRIDFECVQEPTNPKYVEEWGRNLTTIKVRGVFKTKLK